MTEEQFTYAINKAIQEEKRRNSWRYRVKHFFKKLFSSRPKPNIVTRDGNPTLINRHGAVLLTYDESKKKWVVLRRYKNRNEAALDCNLKISSDEITLDSSTIIIDTNG